MPPFASQGGDKGRSYFWREGNIINRAFFVYDVLEDHSRTDTIWILWLSGFDVCLQTLRRVWLHRARNRNARALRPALLANSAASRHERVSASQALKRDGSAVSLLLNTALVMCGAVMPGGGSDLRALEKVTDRVLDKTGCSFRLNSMANEELHARLLVLLSSIWSIVETSDIIISASDANMRDAQGYLRVVGRFLLAYGINDSCYEALAPEPVWSASFAEGVGAPLCLVILALLRSGNGQTLHMMAREMELVSERLNECAAAPVVHHDKIIARFRLRARSILRELAYI